MMLSGLYYQERNLDSAIIYYEHAVRKYPEKEDLMITLGNLYSENKKYDKAGEIFKRLDEKYGLNETSTLANIRNLMKASEFEEALTLVQELLKDYPDEILYNGLLAELYREKGENTKAMEVYNRLMERNPDNPETQLSLCNFLINEKKYDELLQLINTVILNGNVEREDKIALFSKILETEDLVLAKGNEIALSLMVFEAAYGNDGIVELLRPELFIKMKRLSDASERLEEIISKRPENYFAWEKLLLVYLEAKDYKNLEKRGAECALKFNRSFVAKMLYAAGATENKNYQVALEEVRKAEILAGNNEDMILQVLSTRADIYYRMGEFEKAFEIFEKAVESKKGDLTLLNNYAYYLAEQNLKLKEAEKMARQVIETEKDNLTFLDTYAWVLYKRGKVREAEKIMESVISKSEKGDAEFFEHMGYIKKKRRNCAEASRNWSKAIEMDNTKTELLKEIEKCQEKN
jgi:tetratricopeptide (TPR) repeat protein